MTMTKAGEQPTITQALKPCPFCKSEAKHFERHNPMSKWRHSVDCEKCGASGPVEATKAEAISAWNTRTTSLAAQDSYVDATYLRECWNNCLGMDVSDWAHENVHDMLDTIERQAKEIAAILHLRGLCGGKLPTRKATP